jgi:hypothetical protein
MVMNIDKVLKESEVYEIYEDKNLVKVAIDKIKRWSWDKAKKTLQGAFRYLIKFAKDKGIEKQVLDIINRMVGKQYRSLSDLMKISLKEDVLYEGEWWDEAKGNFYGAVSFYPLLTAFLELDKVIKGQGGADMKYVAIYALIWASIVSGKVLSNQYKKKKADKEIDDVGKAYRNMMGM